jgi:hypothetical protein
MESNLVLGVGLGCYFLGVLSGFFIRAYLEKKSVSLPPNTTVLIVVTGVWLISMLVDISSPAYETSPFVHGLMGAIVGFFYRPVGTTTRKDDK